MFRNLLLSVIVCALACGPAVAGTVTVGDDPSAEALRLGKRMYREGILSNGEPIQAMVAADVPVDGRMFTCVNCHQHSGLGSVEGPVIAWPVNGKELYTPRRRTGAWHAAAQAQGPGATERWSLPPQYQAADARPAYTDETLARLLREGVDPAGRTLHRGMPRYRIDDRNMAVLTHYLKNLSVETDPGVDENSIRFATVVTEGVAEADREAMLAVLQTHIDVHNTQTRPHLRRARAGPFYKTEKYGAYRKFELDVWQLSGPRDSWPAQLEAYYQAKPVFALLGGIATGSWGPIHAFCEAGEIPCLFPITDQPVVSDSDWYTLYFSRGLYQEGEAAAAYLRTALDDSQDARVIQVYRTGSDGAVLAQGFRESREKFGHTAATQRVLGADEPVTDDLWRELFEAERPAAVLLWLEAADLEAATGWMAAQGSLQPVPVFVSWRLLAGDTASIPERLRDSVYLTYPRDLPADNALKRSVVQRWLKARKIPVTNLDIQARMYFLGWMLPGAISHMRSEFFRDYFIESFDMMRDQDYAIAVFPRLTFGPGQRYAAKGCYVVQLGEGKDPELIRKSEWVAH
jgi:hypothetical protein